MSDRRLIGLDIGSSSVKAAQVLRKSDGTYVVERQAARRLPRGAVSDGRVDKKERLRVIAVIKEMFAEEGFASKEVVVGLNSSSGVFMQEMTVPMMRPEDIDKALPLAVEAQDPNLSTAEKEISWTVLGEVEGDRGPELKILLYSARKDYVKEIAEVVEAAGLAVVGADLNALAVLRATAVQQRPRNQVDGIVDIGATVTTLLLHHNGVPKMLLLDPDSAGRAATTRISEALGLDDIDEEQAEFEKTHNDEPRGVVAQARNEYSQNLAEKVRNGFDSYLNRSTEFDQIANVTLVGGGALLHGIGYFLRQALGSVPLDYALVADDIVAAGGGDVERNEIGSGGDYLAAIGLATGARI